MSDRHPFVRAALQHAIREWLKDRHGGRHTTAQDMAMCESCKARLWECFAKAAPKSTLRDNWRQK